MKISFLALLFLLLAVCPCYAASTLEDKLAQEHEKYLLLDKSLGELSSKVQSQNDSINNHIGIVTWVSGISIAVVGAIFTVSTVTMFHKNNDTLKSSQSMLDQCKQTLKECDDLRTRHEVLLKDLYGALANELAKLTNEKRQLIHNYNYFTLLSNLIFSDNPPRDEVYRLLTPLVLNPHLEYLGLFKAIAAKNADPEISVLVQEAIEKLKGVVDAPESYQRG